MGSARILRAPSRQVTAREFGRTAIDVINAISPTAAKACRL